MRGWIACLALLALLVAEVSAAPQSTVGYAQSDVTSYNLMGKSHNSTLYNVTLSTAPYEVPVYFVDLWGDRYTMGYDYGVLLGSQISACYDTFLHNLFVSAGLPRFLIPTFEKVLGDVLDWQWNDWLSQQAPAEYLEEIRGIQDGGNSVGVADVGAFISRTMTLANLPGDIGDLQYVFKNEYEAWVTLQAPGSVPVPTHQELFVMISQAMKKLPPGAQCSMFGVWGSRTANGDLFTGRNLDWASNLGLDQYKCIQVWHPEGAYEHSAVGYVAVWGALTGMSAKGLSVHEANLESNQDTFLGFPWLLRLRYIMENAANIDEAWGLWENTNNTVGFNHMVGSSTDAAAGHGALALETMAGYTAYFLDDDPREADATDTDPTTGQTIPVGFPMPEALWRTNHGYDPEIRKHYMWRGTHALRWSMERYMFAAAFFEENAREGTLINVNGAINITSILGDKGPTAYHCQDNDTGSNIISATFQPAAQQMWASWENGSGAGWRPAACNNYVHFDMTRWFTQSP